MKIRTDILLRVYGAYAILFSLACVIVIKVWHLQHREGALWQAKAAKQTTAYFNTAAIKGNIYSSDGSLLATSLPEYEIRMDLVASGLSKALFDKQVIGLGDCLAHLLGDKSAQSYTKLLQNAHKKKQRYFLVKRKIDYKTLQKLKKCPLFSRGRHQGGLIVMHTNKRILPFKTLAARTIGYQTPGVQPVGLEGAYNQYLAGKDGKRLMQKIGGGWMPINDENEIASTDGYNIISTIDINIQDIAESALLEQLHLQKASSGIVVVMEVATGAIKAIANLSKGAQGNYSEVFNAAIGAATESGSTFKLATLMVALEDKKVSLQDTFDVSKGFIQYYDRKMKDASKMPKQFITLQTAFERSSNIAISQAIVKAYKNNPKRFVKGLERMGFGKKMGLQIPGEAQSKLKHPTDKDWSGTTLPWMAIGYEQTQTPLQTLAFYNAVANNGVLLAPLLVSEIRHLGKTIKQFDARVLVPQIASAATLSKARMLLEGVVKNGSAKALSRSVFSIAGKTGTTQIATGKQGYKAGKVRYQASFCGYFPADSPKYSMIVVVTNPTNTHYYGSAVAAPVFKEIASKLYASDKSMSKPIESMWAKAEKIPSIAEKGDEAQLMQAYQDLGFKNDLIRNSTQIPNTDLVKRAKQTKTVPNVKGMGLQDALYILENSALHTVVQGYGKVIAQSIPPGASFASGNYITLTLQ